MPVDELTVRGYRSIRDLRLRLGPVNVLVGPGRPPVTDLADAGVARISVGGLFAFKAYADLVESATELRESGTVSVEDGLRQARVVFGQAFNS